MGRDTHLRFWILTLGAVLVLTAGVSAHAAEGILSPPDAQRLGWMEEALLPARHEGEAPQARLGRLESLVFGAARDGEPMEARLLALHEALLQRKAAMTPVASSASDNETDTGANTDSEPQGFETMNRGNASAQATLPPLASPNAAASDLPMVDLLENKALGRAYGHEPLQTRLARLETRVFGQARSGEASDRVDALRNKIFGTNWPPEQDDETAIGTSSAAGVSAGSAQEAYSRSDSGASDVLPDALPGVLTPDEEARLSAAEMQTFRRRFANESPEARVARLEMTIFKRLAPPQTPLVERLDRVAAVTTADPENPITSAGAPVTRSTMIRSLWPIIPMILLMFL